MLRAALKIVVALMGIALTAIFLLIAIRDASVIGFAKAAVAALVAIRLFSLLRQDKASATEGASGGNDGKNVKLMAIGLAVGFGAPLVLIWLITSFVR